MSLKIEWIEQRSFAHELPTCMYAGAVKDARMATSSDGADLDQEQWSGQSVFAIKQDTKLLGRFHREEEHRVHEENVG